MRGREARNDLAEMPILNRLQSVPFIIFRNICQGEHDQSYTQAHHWDTNFKISLVVQNCAFVLACTLIGLFMVFTIVSDEKYEKNASRQG